MPRKVWLLVAGMIINVTGASFLWPFNTIYLHDHLGKSLSVAGMVLMINSLTGVIGNLLGGVLFDKWGGYKSTLVRDCDYTCIDFRSCVLPRLAVICCMASVNRLRFWNGLPIDVCDGWYGLVRRRKTGI